MKALLLAPPLHALKGLHPLLLLQLLLLLLLLQQQAQVHAIDQPAA